MEWVVYMGLQNDDGPPGKESPWIFRMYTDLKEKLGMCYKSPILENRADAAALFDRLGCKSGDPLFPEELDRECELDHECTTELTSDISRGKPTRLRTQLKVGPSDFGVRVWD